MSTVDQDLTAQRDALAALGVDPNRIYVDHGLTGTNRDRPGLRQALAGCRSGDTLVVTKLDRLARSVPDARDIVDELTAHAMADDTLEFKRLAPAVKFDICAVHLEDRPPSHLLQKFIGEMKASFERTLIS